MEYKIEMPCSVGDMISFRVENSPIRHGRVLKFVLSSSGNMAIITGCIVKCKNAAERYVSFKDIIAD